jgi:hypothetical protein
MRHLLKFAPLAGAALLVAACGGGSTANNAAAAPDNGTEIGNDPMAPDMNTPMPDANTPAMAPDANAPAPAAGNATNSTNAM